MGTDIDSKELHKSLREQHYAFVPFQIGSAAITNAMQAFFKFLELPEAVKSHIDFSISDKHRRGDVGYKHRNANDDIYSDNKDFFHYHPAIFEEYADFLEQHRLLKDFMLAAKPIWEHAYQVLQGIFASFEQKAPGVTDKIFDSKKREHILLRFLKYEWQHAGKYLAKPHFDAGSFTLAIAESAPGLRIGSCPENLRLVQSKKDHAVFMLASNYKKIMDTEQFLPGWHDVIQLDETQLGQSFARWAIVAFIDGHNVEALSRSETHKWY